MGKKTLKTVLFIWGALSLLFFIAVRSEPLFNLLLKEKVVSGYWDRTKYGELYYFSMIKHFREEGLPMAAEKFELSSKHAEPEDCDILTFGDSFFEFSRHQQIPERLATDYGKRVHFINEDHPLDYLREISYSDTTPKLLIYERTERYIPVSFENAHLTDESSRTGSKEDASGLLSGVRKYLFFARGEELYNVMLKRSYLTTSFYSFIATLRFDLFGHISSHTPVYLNGGDNESWLFYYDQVNGERTSFYYDFTQAEIDSICDHIERLADDLYKEYAIQMVFLPIPAKYTICHHVLNDDEYNDFLPRLYKGLDERGVDFIDLYDIYRNSNEDLFYRTDSHWTQAGLDLAYDQLVEYLEKYKSRFLSGSSNVSYIE